MSNNIIKKSEQVADLLKSFSNKNKLGILCFIGKDKKNVSDIIENSNISQSQVSQYLWKMKLEGLLESEKNWKEVIYRIKEKKVLEIIASLKNIFN